MPGILRCLLIASTSALLACTGSGGAQSPQREESFPLERDHVFIWVSKDAAEVAVLERLGLHTDHRTYRHAGQGTASIGFQFENAYLELTWIEDEAVAASKDAEAGSDAAHFIERSRWRQSGASPFGIGLHRRAASAAIPFPTRKYWAPWMKANTFLEVATSSSNAREPMCFVVPEYMAYPSPEKWKSVLEAKPELKKLFVHPLGVRKLTDVKITMSGITRMSPTAAVLSKSGIVKLETGEAPDLELVFDEGAQGKVISARPALPLVLKY